MQKRLTAMAVLAASLLWVSDVAAVTFLTEENRPFNYTEKGELTGMSTHKNYRVRSFVIVR